MIEDRRKDEVFDGLAVGFTAGVVGVILAVSQVENYMDAEPVNSSALRGAALMSIVAVFGFGFSFLTWLRMGQPKRPYVIGIAVLVITLTLLYLFLLQPLLDSWAGICLPPWNNC